MALQVLLSLAKFQMATAGPEQFAMMKFVRGVG